MNKIEKLVAELCPDGVDAYNLENVCFFKKRKSITNKHKKRSNTVFSGVKTSLDHHTQIERRKI